MSVDSIDLDAIVNPWQAIVVVVLIFAVLVLPNVAAWRNSREAKHAARRAADTMEHEAKPNSGGSMRDALDRIEANQVQHGTVLLDLVGRVETLERAAEKRHRLSWRR